MIVKLLTEHHLEFLSFKGGCRGSSESTHVKMPHCWKSHATAHLVSGLAICSIHYYLSHLYVNHGDESISRLRVKTCMSMFMTVGKGGVSWYKTYRTGIQFFQKEQFTRDNHI